MHIQSPSQLLLFFLSSIIPCIHPRFFDACCDKSFIHDSVCNFQVPTPLSERRRRFMAVKWLITAAREQQKNVNKNARMYKKLAKELMDAYNNQVRICVITGVQQLI